MWNQILIVTTLATICLTDEVLDEENKVKRKIISVNQDLPPPPPLPPRVVKCFMSANSHCSKDVLKLKNLLIHFVKEDCARCTSNDETRADEIAASMITYDPIAWKLFLARSGIKLEKKEDLGETLSEIKKIREEMSYPENVAIMPGYLGNRWQY